MKKRTGWFVTLLSLTLVVAVLVIALGIALCIPTSRYFIVGFVKGEHFDNGWPTSYWIDKLKDPEADVRREVAFALGRIGPEARAGVPALAAALKDEEVLVRLNAALALFKIGPDARLAVAELTEALVDEEDFIRMDAALALSRIGPDAKSAVPTLLKVMADKNNRRILPFFERNVSQTAVLALGKIGPGAKEAVPALEELLAEQDETMQAYVTRALHQITAPDQVGKP
jgi:HEAT repeat protein